MAITPLPTAPSRSMPQATFTSTADAFLAALAQFVTDVNNTETNINTRDSNTSTNAANAASSASAAQTAANQAIGASTAYGTCTSISTTQGGANSSIATVVAAGTLYATLQTGRTIYPGQFMCFADTAGSASYIGVRTVSYDSSTGNYSGAVLFSEGSGTFTAWTATLMTDPTKLVPRAMLVVTSGDYSALAGYTYVIAGNHNATLPASPTVGDIISFRNESGLLTPQIFRNGKLIEALAQDLTVDDTNANFSLVYSGSTYGWIIK